jgi:hypothetical protein
MIRLRTALREGRTPSGTGCGKGRVDRRRSSYDVSGLRRAAGAARRRVSARQRGRAETKRDKGFGARMRALLRASAPRVVVRAAAARRRLAPPTPRACGATAQRLRGVARDTKSEMSVCAARCGKWESKAPERRRAVARLRSRHAPGSTHGASGAGAAACPACGPSRGGAGASAGLSLVAAAAGAPPATCVCTAVASAIARACA